MGGLGFKDLELALERVKEVLEVTLLIKFAELASLTRIPVPLDGQGGNLVPLQPDGYFLETTEWPKGSQASCEVWRDDRLDLLAVQGTLKSLLQHHSSKASILWHSAFLGNF